LTPHARSFRGETGDDDDDEQVFEAVPACLSQGIGIAPYVDGTVVSVTSQKQLPPAPSPHTL